MKAPSGGALPRGKKKLLEPSGALQEHSEGSPEELSLPIKFKESLESSRGRSLTPLQESFLAAYSESLDAKEAVTRIGKDHRDRVALVRSLKKEMLEIIELKLVEHAGKATDTLYRFLSEDKPVPQGNLKLEAAKTVLDRVGLAKKEQVEVGVTGTLGLFILPAKEDEKIINKDY